ncbi:MAG: ABC transporter substrate-binding protein [Spirochaetaceae bacterium]|jgi:iron complex transport system substrate-binding protein|nr:ABC transporter substrate-binding protein [Spirochaetaceae bacterium]
MKNVCKPVVVAAALFIAASVPFAWCGGKSDSAGKDSVSAGKISGTVTVTDLAGRKVTLNLPVKKVNVNWSGSGGAFMTMSALLGTEVADYLSSWDGGLQKFRFDMYEEYLSKIPALENIPVVSGVDYADFNLEKLIQLKPDVVIWTLGVREQAGGIAESALAAAGIPLIYIDYHAETIENHTKTTQLLGQLFGKEERAGELIKFYVDNMNIINGRLSKIDTRPLAYAEVTMQGPKVYGNTYGNIMWGAMIKNAGGTNIAEGVVTGQSPVSAEFVISKDPDIIILTGSYWPNNPDSVRMGYLSNEADTQRQISAYANRPGWPQLKAIRNKRLFAIHHGLGREIYDVAAFAFIAKCIHPEQFTDIDPIGMLREYYDRFLPYDLYGVWMTQFK